jgi:hypothetical protein
MWPAGPAARAPGTLLGPGPPADRGREPARRQLRRRRRLQHVEARGRRWRHPGLRRTDPPAAARAAPRPDDPRTGRCGNGPSSSPSRRPGALSARPVASVAGWTGRANDVPDAATSAGLAGGHRRRRRSGAVQPMGPGRPARLRTRPRPVLLERTFERLGALAGDQAPWIQGCARTGTGGRGGSGRGGTSQPLFRVPLLVEEQEVLAAELADRGLDVGYVYDPPWTTTLGRHSPSRHRRPLVGEPRPPPSIPCSPAPCSTPSRPYQPACRPARLPEAPNRV